MQVIYDETGLIIHTDANDFDLPALDSRNCQGCTWDAEYRPQQVTQQSKASSKTRPCSFTK